VRHRAAGGDPGALMKLSVEHSVRSRRLTNTHDEVTNRCLVKMFSPQFFKESLGKVSFFVCHASIKRG
jgi:hypothetical protein